VPRVRKWVDWISEADSSCVVLVQVALKRRSGALHLHMLTGPLSCPYVMGSNLDFVYIYILTTNKKQGVVVWVCIATKLIIVGLSTALTFR
jgi:hypothetical protein